MQIYRHSPPACFRQGAGQYAPTYYKRRDNIAYCRNAQTRARYKNKDNSNGRVSREGEEEFQELLDFVRTQKFDRMGAFAYSEEDDTWAAKESKSDLIPEETKQKRLDLLMEAQMTIYEEKMLRCMAKKSLYL